MSLGVIEVGLLALVTLVVVVVILLRRGQSVWLLSIPVCLGVAAVATPADPLSTLLFLVRFLTPAWLLG